MPEHPTRRDWKSFIRSRLVALRLSPARESEIAEELAQHLEDRWQELMAKGATPDDAARTARTEFSGARLEALLGTLRQAHWHEPPPPGPSRAFSFDSILLDLRHASRALRATPSFTIGALLVLALGTGATTAIFSVADAVALRPLPFPEPDRIVAVGVRAAPAVGGGPQRSRPAPLGRGGAMPGAKPPEPDALASITAQDYLDWEDQQQALCDGSPQRHRRLRLSTPGGRTGVGEGRPRHRRVSSTYSVCGPCWGRSSRQAMRPLATAWLW